MHNSTHTLSRTDIHDPIIVVERLRTPFVVVGLPVALVLVPVLNEVAALELFAEDALDVVNEPG